MMDQRINKALFDKKFLQEVLSQTSMFIMSYEIFKNGILGYIRQFFWHGFDESGAAIYSEEYYERFTGKKPYKAPLAEAIKFFIEVEAIDENDEKEIHRLRGLRDEAAHRMMQYLIDDTSVLIGAEDVEAIIGLNYKIDNWWIKNYEAIINPSFRHEGDKIQDAASVATYLLKYCHENLKG